MNETNLQNLETVANALGEILNRVVFVGGALVRSYATAAAAPQARPTLDVDCIIEIASYGDYGKLEEDLRRRGFRHDQTEGGPICRWICEGIQTDVMPTTGTILGFSNRWHAKGFKHTNEIALPRGQKIKILEPPYFLASKLEAVKDRGWKHLRTSPDFEDVVYILRNRDSIHSEVQEAAEIVRTFICETFIELLRKQDVDEAIASVLDFGEPPGTSQLIRRLMESISEVANKRSNKR